MKYNQRAEKKLVLPPEERKHLVDFFLLLFKIDQRNKRNKATQLMKGEPNEG